MVPASGEIDRCGNAVAINVSRIIRERTAIVESALRPKNRGNLKLLRQLEESIGRERVSASEIGRPAIEAWSVVELARLGHWIPIAGDKGPVRIGLPGNRIGDDWRNADKAVGRTVECREPHAEASLDIAVQAGTEKIVNRMRVRVVHIKHEPTGHLFAKTYNNRIVVAAVPWT